MFGKKDKDNSDADDKKKDSFSHEKRKHKRFSRNYILSYREADNPDKKHAVTQLKNISEGGICFITDDAFKPGTVLILELNTPYIAETTYLEGMVLESSEKVQNMIYETRLQFGQLRPESEFLLQKMIDYFKNGDKQ